MSVEAQPLEVQSFNSEKEFQAYTDEHSDRCILSYKKEVFDVTDFLDCHPGGDQIVVDCNGKDISELFHANFPHSHSKAAFRMMLKYKVGELKYQEENSSTDTGSNDEAYPAIGERYIQYKDYRFDRTKGMCIQTLNLNKEQYLDFIHHSHALHLDNCLLFEWRFLDFFTRNKWWYIPMVWVPIIIFLNYLAITMNFEISHSRFDDYMKVESSSFSVFGPLLAFAFGIFCWTLAEYLLHRFLFHMDELFLNHKPLRFAHFLLHGIHHVIPTDPERLVFPPPMAALIALPIYLLMNALVGGNTGLISFTGILGAYVLYDFFHWWLHHGKGGLAYFRDLKRYHNIHHYFDENLGFGITSKLWDVVFGTLIKYNNHKTK